MSKNIDVARVNATGALIPIHDGNRDHLSSRPGITMTTAKKDPETGRLEETSGADYTAMIAASNDLQRIGEALQNNTVQRETLLTAALKLPNAEQYLQQLGVYKGSEDDQYIDPNTLHANNAGLPDDESDTVIENVTEQLAEKATKPAKKGKASKKTDSDTVASSPDPLADL